MIKKNNSGFSLMELIVVIAIASIVGLAATSLVMSLTKQIRTVSLKTDSIMLQTQLVSALKKSVACRFNLINNAINLGATPNLDLTTIKDFNDIGVPLSTIVPGLGMAIYPGSRLQVNSMRFTGPAGIGVPALIKTETASLTYIGSLRVTFVTIPGEIVARPLVIPSVLIKTNLLGVSQNCALEKQIDLLGTCQTVLGLTKDIITGACLPMDPSAKKGLCESLGGTQPPIGMPWYCQLPTAAANITCLNPSEVVVGFNNGLPICQVPVAGGIWSGWGPCTVGTKTRSCLVGICSGSTTAPCP